MAERLILKSNCLKNKKILSLSKYYNWDITNHRAY